MGRYPVACCGEYSFSYEVGFKEDNITCFIGRVLNDELKTNYNFIKAMESMGLEILTDNTVETLLHTSSIDDVIDTYKEMIKYVNNNNIFTMINFT